MWPFERANGRAVECDAKRCASIGSFMSRDALPGPHREALVDGSIPRAWCVKSTGPSRTRTCGRGDTKPRRSPSRTRDSTRGRTPSGSAAARRHRPQTHVRPSRSPEGALFRQWQGAPRTHAGRRWRRARAVRRRSRTCPLVGSFRAKVGRGAWRSSANVTRPCAVAVLRPSAVTTRQPRVTRRARGTPQRASTVAGAPSGREPFRCRRGR